MIGNLGAEEKRIFEHAVYRVWPAGVSKFEEFEDYGQGKSFLTLLGAHQILLTGRRVSKMGRCVSCW